MWIEISTSRRVGPLKNNLELAKPQQVLALALKERSNEQATFSLQNFKDSQVDKIPTMLKQVRIKFPRAFILRVRARQLGSRGWKLSYRSATHVKEL
jgi:hypothetical protein